MGNIQEKSLCFCVSLNCSYMVRTSRMLCLPKCFNILSFCTFRGIWNSFFMDTLQHVLYLRISLGKKSWNLYLKIHRQKQFSSEFKRKIFSCSEENAFLESKAELQNIKQCRKLAAIILWHPYDKYILMSLNWHEELILKIVLSILISDLFYLHLKEDFNY